MRSFIYYHHLYRDFSHYMHCQAGYQIVLKCLYKTLHSCYLSHSIKIKIKFNIHLFGNYIKLYHRYYTKGINNRGKIGGHSTSVVVEKYEKANSIINISIVILYKRLKFFPIFKLVY